MMYFKRQYSTSKGDKQHIIEMPNVNPMQTLCKLYSNTNYIPPACIRVKILGWLRSCRSHVGSTEDHIGSPRVFGYQLVGIRKALGGSTNVTGFVFWWNIGYSDYACLYYTAYYYFQ